MSNFAAGNIASVGDGGGICGKDVVDRVGAIPVFERLSSIHDRSVIGFDRVVYRQVGVLEGGIRETVAEF